MMEVQLLDLGMFTSAFHFSRIWRGSRRGLTRAASPDTRVRREDTWSRLTLETTNVAPHPGDRQDLELDHTQFVMINSPGVMADVYLMTGCPMVGLTAWMEQTRPLSPWMGR